MTKDTRGFSLADPLRSLMLWTPGRIPAAMMALLVCLGWFVWLLGAYSETAGTLVIALCGAASLAVLMLSVVRMTRERPLILVLIMALLAVLSVAAHFSLLSVSPGRMKSVLTPMVDGMWNYDLGYAMAWEENYWSGGYLIVMALFSRMESFPLLYAVKLLDLFSLSLAAAAAGRLAAARNGGLTAQAAACFGTMLLPTMLMNGGLWVQCDAIFAALTLWGLVLLLEKHPLTGCMLWGAAVAFKLQSAFLFPLLIVFFMVRRLGIRHLAAGLAVFMLLHAPMLMNGEELSSVLGRYNKQILITAYGADFFDESEDEGEAEEDWEGEESEEEAATEEKAPTHEGLADHAASVYGLMTIASVREFSGMGLYLSIAASLIVVFALLASRRELTADILLTAALLLSCGLPLILPQVNARFLYLAGILALTRMNSRLRIAEAALLEFISLCCYVEAIFSTQAQAAVVFPAQALALAGIVVACMVAWELLCMVTGRDLRGDRHVTTL